MSGSALARDRSKIASSLAVGSVPPSSQYFTLIWSQRSIGSSLLMLTVVLMETASVAEPAASITTREPSIDFFAKTLLIASPSLRQGIARRSCIVQGSLASQHRHRILAGRPARRGEAGEQPHASQRQAGREQGQ